MQAMDIHAAVVSHMILGPHVDKVILSLEGQLFPFKAGQYVQVKVRDGEKWLSRCFSICSSPNQRGQIELIMRPSESRYKALLLGDREKVEVKLGMAQGNFVLPEDSGRPLVFIAAGIGITPYLSMMRYSLEERLSHKITLLHIGRDNEVFAPEIPQGRIAYHSCHVLQEDLLARIHHENISALFYVCGPPKRVEQFLHVLYRYNIEDENLITEQFSGYL